MKSTLGNKSYTVRDLIPLSHSLHWTAAPSLLGNKVNTGLANSPGEQKHCLTDACGTKASDCPCLSSVHSCPAMLLLPGPQPAEPNLPSWYLKGPGEGSCFWDCTSGVLTLSYPYEELLERLCTKRVLQSWVKVFSWNFCKKKKIQQHGNVLWTDTCSDTISILFKNVIHVYSYFTKYSS